MLDALTSLADASFLLGDADLCQRGSEYGFVTREAREGNQPFSTCSEEVRTFVVEYSEAQPSAAAILHCGDNGYTNDAGRYKKGTCLALIPSGVCLRFTMLSNLVGGVLMDGCIEYSQVTLLWKDHWVLGF